jgi:hypothetical protein
MGGCCTKKVYTVIHIIFYIHIHILCNTLLPCAPVGSNDEQSTLLFNRYFTIYLFPRNSNRQWQQQDPQNFPLVLFLSLKMAVKPKHVAF